MQVNANYSLPKPFISLKIHRVASTALHAMLHDYRLAYQSNSNFSVPVNTLRLHLLRLLSIPLLGNDIRRDAVRGGVDKHDHGSQRSRQKPESYTAKNGDALAVRKAILIHGVIENVQSNKWAALRLRVHAVRDGLTDRLYAPAIMLVCRNSMYPSMVCIPECRAVADICWKVCQ